MTGEITLRGQVLPIGGVKEKVLAAHRAGVKTVVLPARNKHDLHDVPGDVREELKFELATRVEEVLAAALGPAKGSGRGSHPTKCRKPRRAARKADRPPVRKGPARAAAGA